MLLSNKTILIIPSLSSRRVCGFDFFKIKSTYTTKTITKQLIDPIFSAQQFKKINVEGGHRLYIQKPRMCPAKL